MRIRKLYLLLNVCNASYIFGKGEEPYMVTQTKVTEC